MNNEEIKELVDYFLSSQNEITSLVIATLALFASVIAIGVSYYTFRKSQDSGVTEYLSVIWNDVINTCLENPQYIDITKTEHYYRLMDNDEVLKYEAYCYKAWGHVKDIITNNRQDDEKFEPIIRWVSSYHYTWLKRNPSFFNHEPFWEKVEEIRKKPQMIFGYRELPSNNGDIDWDIVSEDYHNYILSPYAPEMVVMEVENKSRNLILNYLNSIPAGDLKQMDVLDFGCGPGNLIPHVAGRVNSLAGLDISQGSLKIASELASKYENIQFESICSNILDLDESKKYDLIISSNSILPKTRNEVIELFKKLREHLKPSGKLVAILPSFDTTIYLKTLWEEYFRNLSANEKQVTRISQAFKETKRMDENEMAYADDGHNIQSYHTKESIIKESQIGGFRLAREPEKVYYPWELTRRFDYGYFPSAEEEIWDWFIIAERCEFNGHS